MLRCKEGDLAVILRGPYTGYFVTVGRFLGTVPGYAMSSGKTITPEDVWEVISQDVKPRFPGARTCVQDINLQPIRPGRTPVTTETKKEVTA
jgi:hypothetical protein